MNPDGPGQQWEQVMQTTEIRELTGDELDIVSGGEKSKAGGTQTVIDIGPIRITGGDGTFGLAIKGVGGVVMDSEGGSASLGGKHWSW
jgi:hypothetical protein